MESLQETVSQMKLKAEMGKRECEAQAIQSIEANMTPYVVGGTIKIEKRPFICPKCHTECAYTIKEFQFLEFSRYHYSRTLCPCEAKQQEEDRLKEEEDRHNSAMYQIRIESKIVGKLKSMTFKTFDKSDKTLKDPFRQCLEYVKSWPNKRGLVLSGTWGCGKTHLAIATGQELIHKEVPVQFWPGMEVLERIRRSYNDNGDDPVDALSKIPVLIYDDLGTERIASDSNGDWAREQLLRIFYWRDIRELPTIITSNYSPGDLGDKLGGATVSRIIGMCDWIEIGAADYRVKK